MQAMRGDVKLLENLEKRRAVTKLILHARFIFLKNQAALKINFHGGNLE